MFRRHLPATAVPTLVVAVATLVVVLFAGAQAGLGADRTTWTSSLKTGDIVARGTVWNVDVTPAPDEVEFWASSKVIATDTSAPFETPLDLPAGDYKLGFCYHQDGKDTCPTNEPGTGIVARVTVVEPVPTPTTTAPTTSTTTAPTTSTTTAPTTSTTTAPTTSTTTAPTTSTTTAPTTSTTTQTTTSSSKLPTRNDSAPPKAVSQIDVTGAAATSVSVQWPKSRDNVGVTGYGLFLNGTSKGTTPDTQYTFASLSCGTGFLVGVDAFDAAGNHSSQTSTTVSTSACLDNVSPSVPTGIKLAAATDSSVVLSWLPSTDNVGVVGYGVYVGGLRVASSSQAAATLSNLTCGRSYAIGIDAVDAAGNRSAHASAYFATTACVDASAPSAPSGLGASATATSVSLSWSGSTDNVGVAGYELYQGSSKVATTSQTTSTFTGLACGTAYTLGVDAYDAAGNRSPVASMATSTLPCAPSTPTGSTWTSSLKTGDVVPRGTVWKVDVTPAPDEVEFWASSKVIATDTSAPFETPLDLPAGDYKLGFCYVENGTATCPTNEPGTGIVARITIVDSSPASTDTSPPSVPGSLRVVTADATTVSVGWSASTDDTGVAGYGLYRGSSLTGSTTQTSTTFTGLTCGTAYPIAVDAYDAAGNRSSKATMTVSTAACTDTVAPTVPTNVVAGTRTATSVALSWSPSTDNVGVTGYELFQGGTRVATTTGTTGIVSGLTCGTNYTLGVDAYDAAGNRSSQAVVMVATTACVDTQAPTAPTGLKAGTITQTSMAVSWTPSTDNVGVAGYDVYRNGTKVGSSTSAAYSLSGLTCNSAYTMGVVAYDAAGNRSTQTQLVATTSACVVTTSTGPVSLSPSGNDATCSRGGAPCATLSRAYAIAQSGDTINVAGGSYAGGVLAGTKTLTYQAAADVSITSTLEFRSLQNVTFNGPFAVTVPGESAWSLRINGDSRNLTFNGFTGHTFDITDCSTNITLNGGSWGDYTGRPWGGDSSAGGDQTTTLPCGDGIVRNLVLDGVRFHDVQYGPSGTWGGAHPDCLQVGGAIDGLVIRNSIFERCGNTFIGTFLDWGSMWNLTIENTLFRDIADSGAAVQIGNKPGWVCAGIIFRYNTFDSGNVPPLINCPTDPNGQVYGNVFTSAGSCGQAVWKFNVWGSAPCGSNSVAGTVAFVDKAAGNYHLAAGSLAIGKGDPTRYPSTDFEGTTRPSPPDAGYDER